MHSFCGKISGDAPPHPHAPAVSSIVKQRTSYALIHYVKHEECFLNLNITSIYIFINGK